MKKPPPRFPSVNIIANRLSPSESRLLTRIEMSRGKRIGTCDPEDMATLIKYRLVRDWYNTGIYEISLIGMRVTAKLFVRTMYTQNNKTANEGAQTI